MYPLFLGIHSWLRWILVATMLVLIVKSLIARRQNTPYTPRDRKLADVFFWIFNIQFLLGIIMYVFLSPYTQAAFSDLSAAMSNSTLRFFLIEHPFAMILAIGAGHSGLAKAKRAEDDATKHKYIFRAASISLFFITVAIPWPFLPYGRSLFFWTLS